MEAFASQFPAVVIAVLSAAVAGLVWYMRTDRAHLVEQVERLADSVDALRQELHGVVTSHEARLAGLERVVDYHIRHNGARLEGR